MPNLVLTYFDGPGRAEPIRVALRISGLAFEDRRLKFPEFAEARARGDFPLGSVPVLTVDGVDVVQTTAMLRYVARVGDRSLYPEDPWAATMVDSVLECLNDSLSNAMLPSLFERDMAKKLAMRAELLTGPMARVYGYIEGVLSRSGGPFVAGGAMSVADLVLAAGVEQIRRGSLDGITVADLAKYPRILAAADAVAADPRLRTSA